MYKLDAYIRNSIISAVLVVLLIILTLYLVFSFVDELTDLSPTYQIKHALYYILLTAPRRAYEMLPMSALVGCLIGLGTLASSSELTIMRAAGVSLNRILWSVAKPTLMLMLVGLILGEYLAPISEAKAQAFRSLMQSGSVSNQITKHGLWHKINDTFIHINSIQPNGELIGITRYQFDNFQQLVSASFAKNATYQDGAWYLSDITNTKFTDTQITTSKNNQEIWQVNLTPELLNVLVLNPDSLSISALWSYGNYLTQQNLDNSKYMLSFWHKILQPVVTIALVLLAISFIFGPLRSVTLGQRIFTGVLVGFIFSIFQDLLGPASLVFGFSPLLAATLPSIICLCCGLFLLKRAG